MIWCHDFCCYIGFGKDHVHLPSFWKILSFSLFDFCQHQVLNPQEVLKPITSLRDFGLFPQVHWSLGGWIFHALTSKDYLWGKEGGNECVFQILLPKQSTLHFPQYAWSGFSFWWLRTLTGYIPIQNKKFKVKKKKEHWPTHQINLGGSGLPSQVAQQQRTYLPMQETQGDTGSVPGLSRCPGEGNGNWRSLLGLEKRTTVLKAPCWII